MSHLGSRHARTIGPAPRYGVSFARADAMRVERLITRVGFRGAAILLNIGETTLDAAREEGTMQEKTRERILRVLDIIDGWNK